MTLFSRRIKEVGIRKVSGAGRGDLIYQFMTENILSTLISIAGAICIAEILLPWFNLMLGIELGMDLFSPMYEILILLGIAFLANIIVSLYATNFFSSLEPESLIRGSFDKTDGKGQFKKILVAYQFAIAAFLISSTIVITDQVNFMNHKDLGFNKDQLLVIDESSIGTRANVIKNDLQKDPDILSITKSTWFPTVGHYTGVSGFQDGWKKPITLHIVDVDENFVPTLGLRLIKGRNFDLVFASDSGTVVVNEEAVKELGIADPMRDSLHFFGNNLKVIGVIKDFNYSSLRDRVEPFAFQFSNNPNSSLAVKIKKGKIKEVVSYLGDVWRRINPDKELHFSFLDDNVNHQYVNEKQIFKALLSGSSIAILIALMSVFALSSFQIETKTKEIAIRKVVGASVPEIVWLLISGFLAMIAAANVVAWPVAYYITEKWLNGFTYRIDISASPFLLTGILVVGISLLTLALRAIKAATANPVESLRYE
jgi:putative ABC transport system permease protein